MKKKSGVLLSQGAHIQASPGRKVFCTANLILLVVLTLSCLLPFIYVIAVSFSENYYVTTNQVTFWPKGFTLNAYRYILERKSFWT